MAVTEVARIRSSVSGSTVNSSWGNPEKADPAVLSTTRPSIPAQVASLPDPDVPLATRAVRRSDPPPMNPVAMARAQRRWEIDTRAPVTPSRLRKWSPRTPANPSRSCVRCVLRQPVHGVLHGVGGEDGSVVSLGMSRLDIPLEEDLDAQVEEVVAGIRAMDLGHPHIRLAPPVRSQAGHLSYPGRSCTRSC